MTVPRFYFSMDDDPQLYEAVGYGDRWNGWARPIVTAEVLVEVAEHLDRFDDEMSHTLTFDDAGVATIAERYRGGHEKYAEPGVSYDSTLEPDANGHYLLYLGLTLNMEGDD
ncbi:Uncharacterised protein (plasmid) [Tsukamurella tyrosinosolvens]|uniref:Uncharacterized protein n=1 Tax=Tsukamurella tyrosinosolvens TaxID=57704 RepID=A0A1H4V290_TSUTY|nr:hypothetical protein [Tsukamurella tyrosinosolvens]KXO91072.1 hypothetical protein AXK58_21820 [Tsukamurella tyrosinosolvens]SEC75117.1 hypothetical protein SAMN04489793_3117 [Tsukamurella tyrosinosolvens]VEH90730.1 Uncharacterised protein [Tsukamurella tyrosinosolvens]